MKIFISCLIILLLGLLGTAVRAGDQLVLYDHFPQGFIDETKWGASQTIVGTTILEYVREIQGDLLHMSNRAFGNQGSNNGKSTATVRLNSFGFPGGLTIARASIKVKAVEVAACSDTNPTLARAQLVGNFFKISEESNGVMDHVLGVIEIVRSSSSADKQNVLHVYGKMVHCLSTDCLNAAVTVKELGKVKLGQWATVQIEWNEVDKEFIFTLDKNIPQSISYSNVGWTVYPLSSPGQYQGINLEAQHKIANCMAERQMGFLDADFDNVFINEGAIP